MRHSESSEEVRPMSLEEALESKKSVPVEIDDASKEEIRCYLTELYAAYASTVDEHMAPIKRHFPFCGPMRAVITLLRGRDPGELETLFIQSEPADDTCFEFPSPGPPVFLEELWDRDGGPWVLQELLSYPGLVPDRARVLGRRRAWHDAWRLFQAVSTSDELRRLVLSILDLFGVFEVPRQEPEGVGGETDVVVGHHGTAHALAIVPREPEALDSDVDIVVEDHALRFPSLSSRFKPVGRWAVELKTEERPSVEAIGRLARYVDVEKFEKAILATTSFVTWPAEQAAKQHDRVFLWDGNTLAEFILRARVLREGLLKPLLLGAEHRLRELPGSLRIPTEGDELVRRLRVLPRGPDHYEDYQNLCADVLRFLFAQSFRRFAVRTQIRTVGGHEIRDALIANRPLREFWQRARDEFGANHILFEFKNLSRPVTKEHVEQVRTYISNNVKRIGRFGILVSRDAPSRSARTARLHAYDKAPECLILMVDDTLVVNMIQAKEQGEDPESVLEDLKEAFELSF